MMGKDNLYWKKKIKLERTIAKRKERENILIVCNGKTEKNYFNAFRVSSVSVKILDTEKNTKSLVEFAREKKESYDQVWCVFDKDDFKQFNNAIKMAEDNSFYTAYSNECFELWFILHFEYFTSNIGRKEYYKKLTKLFGFKYDKVDKTIYERLLSKQKTAIKNAKKLLKEYNDFSNPAKNCPLTTVFKLVEELNKYIN